MRYLLHESIQIILSLELIVKLLRVVDHERDSHDGLRVVLSPLLQFGDVGE